MCFLVTPPFAFDIIGNVLKNFITLKLVVVCAAAAVSVSAIRMEKGKGMCVRFIPFACFYSFHFRTTNAKGNTIKKEP